MKETEAWIKRELPAMGSDYVVNSDGRSRMGSKYEIQTAVLSECHLTLRTALDFESIEPPRGHGPLVISVYTVPLKQVDISKLLALEDAVGTGWSASKPSYIVSLNALPNSGAPFTRENSNSSLQTGARFWTGPKSTVVYAGVRVRDKNMADQVAQVFRRAAVLCGAPTQPVEIVPLSTVQKPQSPPSKPASPAASKMTNDEVIQLATAGLSEQVIRTSIHQAPAKAFDLSPTGLIALKKASVSDAVILVMVQSNAPVPAPVSDAKVPPKYDATLTERPKPVAAPVSQNACSGVESMGLYKNEIFDRAMGGGIVEWLAKIRNNTGVTKIVVFGWRDQYGQQQRAQVQIRGGEIASPRLDLTQARVIPPATDVRVLSCE
jgi:hypothetical protein